MAVQKGYFLIADITGYTQYLSETELDHAQNILSTLLNLLIEHTRPPLIISRLAGDAVISYGLSDRFVGGQTFVESIEDTYVSFRRQVELMVRNTTCTCKACQAIASLDLKFFVHHGEFAVQKLDAHDELVGSDVNLLHRLLKNHVTEQTGLRAYTLFTDAAITQLGLAGEAGHMTQLVEAYEHLPPVTVHVEDMHAVWEARRHQSQFSIAPEDELIQVSTLVAMPREQLWNYLIDPVHYNVLTGGLQMVITERRGARVASGSILQCYHGDGTILPLTVVEWQPFDRFIMSFDVPVPFKGITALNEIRLEAVAGGTRLIQLMSKCKGTLAGRVMGDMAFKSMARKFEEDMVRFRDHVEADLRRAGEPPLQAVIPMELVRAAARDSLVAA
jgi:hypothetical protein